MHKFLKIIFIATIIIILILISGWYSNKRIYDSIFRLSELEVTSFLQNREQRCSKFAECELLAGDIIVRRYITERTRTFDEVLDPYFTHSAVYLGNGEIFEVIGNEKNSADDIQILKLNESNWLKEDMETFVIIRPKSSQTELEPFMNNLKGIAVDDRYVFGFPKDGNTKTTCADIIIRILQDNRMLPALSDEPKIITPDYLFLVTERDEVNFEIVGYN